MDVERYNELLKVAQRAAVAGCKEIIGVYSSDADFGIQTKEDNTPVTRADFASNAAISKLLTPTGITILSEESEHESYDVRKTHELLWVVDPLDGTKEFIKRNDMFCVCIALVENHKAVMGVVALPTENVIYYTHMNSDDTVCACRAKFNNEGQISDVVSLPLSHEMSVPHVIVGSVSHASQHATDLAAVLRDVDGWGDVTLRGVGSCIKQCMIAEGSAAFYIRGGGTKEWDTAAGQAILEAAGAHLLEIPSLVPLSYNRRELYNPGFVAYAGDVDSAALLAMRKMVSSL